MTFNIALIVIAGVRADHVSCYGYSRETTPFLDASSVTGTRFARCFAPTSRPADARACVVTGHPAGPGAGVRDAPRPTLAQLLGEAYQSVELTASGDDHCRPLDEARRLLGARRAAPPAEGGGKPYFLLLHSQVLPDGHRDVPEDIVARYDAAICAADQALRTVLEGIDFTDTVVIVTSDHGEELETEIGRVRRGGRLHQDLLHVPLFLWLPAPLRARQPPPLEERSACTLDVVPTLLALVGRPTGGFPGHDLLDLPCHRHVEAADHDAAGWPDGGASEAGTAGRIELRAEIGYPLKSVRATRDHEVREFCYNLAYDPGERVDLQGGRGRAVPNSEPITFIVAVNDRRELEQNLIASPVARSPRHQWILVENEGNRRYRSMSRLYADACAAAHHDLVFFMHQDLYLPPGWDERLFEALWELERLDPRWGVLGAAGALAGPAGGTELRGHWCDPHGYFRRLPLPAEVDGLDEQWLGLRRSRGLALDPDLPSFHCLGIDLPLTARDAGMKSYAIDAFVWHKWRDRDGRLIARPADSPKIAARSNPAFVSDFAASTAYIDAKWSRYKPFHATSWRWT